MRGKQTLRINNNDNSLSIIIYQERVVLLLCRLLAVPYFSVGFSRLVRFDRTPSLPPSWFLKASATWGECLNYRAGPSQYIEWQRRASSLPPPSVVRHSPHVALTFTNQDGGSSMEASKIPRKNRGLLLVQFWQTFCLVAVRL